MKAWQLKSWVVWALLTTVIWGFWGLFPKLSVKHISPDSALFYQGVGGVVCGIIVLICSKRLPELSLAGGGYAFLAGFTAIFGGLFYLYATKETDVIPVVSVTALYPIVTILLAIFLLGEALTIRRVAALVLALCAVLLVSTEQIPDSAKLSDDTAAQNNPEI